MTFYEHISKAVPANTGSSGIDTSAVDKYRSGIELTLGRHYSVGLCVIRSADGTEEGDHAWVDTMIGAHRPRISDSDAYSDMPTWDATTYIKFRQTSSSGSWSGFVDDLTGDGSIDTFDRRRGDGSTGDVSFSSIVTSWDRYATGKGPRWNEMDEDVHWEAYPAYRDTLTREGTGIISGSSSFDTDDVPSDKHRSRTGFDYESGYDSVAFGGLRRS